MRDQLPLLREIVAWHRQGTGYGIHVDSADGLMYAGEQGVQLTWMDASVGGWVATPRPGKPGEVNALWYGALRSMAGLARRLGESSDHDEALAGSTRFWNEPASYCFDVMDGPGGEEPSLRPNQSLAISVPTAPSTIRSNGAWWTSVPANRRFYAF